MTWQEILKKARSHDLSLEALLRGCQPIVSDDFVVLICPHEFHRNRLIQQGALLRQICGEYEVYESKEAYIKAASQNPLVKFALEELGGQVIC